MRRRACRADKKIFGFTAKRVRALNLNADAKRGGTRL